MSTQPKKLLFVFGTRPEAIKMLPLVQAAQNNPKAKAVVCLTGQHREMVDSLMDLFSIRADYNLDIMLRGQGLSEITSKILEGLRDIMMREHYDWVIVQGDTTSAFTAALAAFYARIPVVHIEAGLRTNNPYSPYPEEMNRMLIAKLAALHMASTAQAVDNLHKEGITEQVFLTGSTIIDAITKAKEINLQINYSAKYDFLQDSRAKVLVTIHRRENLGLPLANICRAIAVAAAQHKDVLFVWPVHPNKAVSIPVAEALAHIGNVRLIEPLPYPDMINLIDSCHLIVSDSGGIQEEANVLGKKLIITRKETERTEVVESGLGILVGVEEAKVLESINTCLKSLNEDKRQLSDARVYGEHGVSERIIELIIAADRPQI